MTVSWDVFVAYASQDRQMARELVEALARLEVSVCFDQDVLHGGDNWHAFLPKSLEQSAMVVALVSEHTEASHFENSEVVRAITLVRSQGRRLVPVWLAPGVEAPYGTEQLHALEMFDSSMVEDVARHLASLVPDRVVPVTDRAGMISHLVPALPRVFVGRDDLVANVLAGLASGGVGLVTQAIAGMGGIGKTTVAAAVAIAARASYEIVWWVRAESPVTLVADLAALAGPLRLPEFDEVHATAEAVVRALSNEQRRWLVVFDNAPDQRSIEDWLPRRGEGAVLITSRLPTFTMAERTVDVATLSNEMAERFLRARAGASNPAVTGEDLTAVLDRLGGLPLALEQAAAWVSHIPNRTFAKFVVLYDDAAEEPFPDGTRPAGYDHTASTTWRVSIAAAEQQAALAPRVLGALAYLAPDELPCAWVRDVAGAPSVNRAGATEIDQALDALHAASLATITGNDMVSVHRVVQAISRRATANEPASFEAAVTCLRRQSPGDTTDHHTWADMAILAPHAAALSVHTNMVKVETAHDLWWILNDVATFQRASGKVADAVTSATIATAIAESHLGPGHPDTLASRNNLALAYRSAGDSHRAIHLHQVTLADCERVLGPDHPETLHTRNHLANAYRSAGDLGRAIPLYEAILADRERVLGPDHPDTLQTRNNLALSFRSARDLERAIALYEATLADRERVLGPDHPDTLQSRNNLASAYRWAGDLERAIPLLKATLADRTRLLGRDHPNTFLSRNNLALAYRSAGDLTQAIALFVTTLADRERVLGRDHPDTLVSRNSLAGAYHAAGDLEQSIALFESTLADREHVLGADHPRTLVSRNGLARVYWSAGYLERAISLFETALADSERVLGPDHPATAKTRDDLELVRRALSRH